jgi:isopentenyl-diphosphate delta-isomerase
VLVNEEGKHIGYKEKLKAHEDEDFHLAFSVFIFDRNNRLLLQRRQSNKYHFGGLWSNACCSHPFALEGILSAGKRRLQEEMGFSCNLKNAFIKKYNVQCSNELYENEFNFVLLGEFNGVPKINFDEVECWKWININELIFDLKNNVKDYTPWFPILLFDVIENHSKVTTLN